MTIEEEYKQFVLNEANNQLFHIDYSGAENLFMEILKLPPSERVMIDAASKFVRDGFLKNQSPDFQRYFLMALYFGYRFFEHKAKQLTPELLGKAMREAAGKSSAAFRGYGESDFTRNFPFNSIEEANIKWEQVLKHREHLVAYHYSYYHIDGMPDYVVSVSCSFDKMDLILSLLGDLPWEKGQL